MLNRLNKKLYKHISFDNDSNKIINNILLVIAKRYYNKAYYVYHDVRRRCRAVWRGHLAA